jgi:WD40 repeat protein
MSHDGNLVAAGGLRVVAAADQPIYLFDRSTGKMVGRMSGDQHHACEPLVFSADGRYLAAVLSGRGLRVFDRDKNWSEMFSDVNYGDEAYGAAFTDDGLLATSSCDGKIRP